MTGVRLIALLGTLLLVISCGSGATRRTGSPEMRDLAKGEGSAYLFDCTLRQDRVRNRFRVECYIVDSLIRFGARGYLGKGIFAGILRNDSLIVHFPSTGEFLAEPVRILLAGEGCEPAMDSERLLALFRGEDSVLTHAGNSRKATVVLRGEGDCLFELQFRFARKKGLWSLAEISIEDHARVSLVARSRESRLGIRIPERRMLFSVPESARQIRPHES